MEPTDQLAHVLPALCAVVDDIHPSQLHDPTPCEHFSVSDVLDHMIVLGGTFALLFRGEVPTDIEAPARNGAVPSDLFRTTMTDLLDAVQSDGALERTIVAPVGQMAGSDFARFVAFDGLIHGWDLATATGIEYEPSDDVVAAIDGFARLALTADMRDGETFRNETSAADGASPLERLVAFSGRTLAPVVNTVTTKG